MIYYDKSSITDNWLGYPPADDSKILEKEKELGLTLPKSYKDFLKASNGFRQISFFTGNLCPIGNVDWLSNTDSDFLNMFSEGDDINITDQDYYNYSETQRSEFFRLEYLKNSIRISEWTDGSLVLLNPKIKFGEEFEAWVYANWYPGAKRFKSFEDLILDALKETHELLKK